MEGLGIAQATQATAAAGNYDDVGGIKMTFAGQGPQGMVWISNRHASAELHVRVNEETVTATNSHHVVQPKTSCVIGLVTHGIQTEYLSLYTATGGLALGTDLNVVGFRKERQLS